MIKDIKKLVAACGNCCRYKMSQQKSEGKMLTWIAEAIWETMCLDFVGALPRTKHENTTLIVIVDSSQNGQN